MRITALFAIAAVAGCSRNATVGSPASTSSPAPAPAANTTPNGARATATINDIANTKIGSATFTDTPAGLLVQGSVTGLGLGAHGAHLHAIGICTTPAFTSAGGHFNPTAKQHGFKNPAGHHAGDMPNIVSPAAGAFNFQFVVDGVKLTGTNGLLDADGAAIVIHSGEDDYMTDPSGNSGGRIACGVITMAK